MAQEEHQFGDGTLGRAVVAADDACLEQLQAGAVALHLDHTPLALGDVDDDDAPFVGFRELTDEPFFLWSIARTESLEHNSLQAGYVEYGADDAFADAGEEGKHHDVVSNR